MALIKVLSYIDTLISQVETKEIKKKNLRAAEPNRFINVLHHLHQLIEHSDDGEKSKAIEAALLYIQQIKFIDYLGSGTEFWRFARESGITPLPQKKDVSFSAPVLNNKRNEAIGNIYVTLLDFYEKNLLQRQPLWEYEYPLDQGQVVNRSIQYWQKAMIPLREPSGSYKDFLRDASVKGMRQGIDDSGIHSAIHRFVKKSSYTKEDKELVEKWLESNGGQDNNRFLDLLLLHKQFSDTELCKGKAQTLEHHWYLNEKGKICLSCDNGIQTLHKTLNDIMYMVETDDEDRGREANGVEASEIENSWVEQENEHAFLLRMKAQIELDVMTETNGEKSVVPKIKSLKTYGYTNLLRPPKQPVYVSVMSDEYRTRLGL